MPRASSCKRGVDRRAEDQLYMTHAVITPNFSYELHPRDKPKPALAHILPTGLHYLAILRMSAKWAAASPSLLGSRCKYRFHVVWTLACPRRFDTR